MSRLIALVALLALVACGAMTTPEARTTPGPAATGTPAPPARPALPATPLPATPLPASPTKAYVGPPALTLAHGTATRSALAISVTWRTEQGAMHAHGMPNFHRMDALVVPAGALLTLTAPGFGRPTSAEVEAHTLVGDEIGWGTPHPPSLPTRIADGATMVIVNRAPGEYILIVRLRWGDNQASYDFRLRITP